MTNFISVTAACDVRTKNPFNQNDMFSVFNLYCFRTIESKIKQSSFQKKLILGGYVNTSESGRLGGEKTEKFDLTFVIEFYRKFHDTRRLLKNFGACFTSG